MGIATGEPPTLGDADGRVDGRRAGTDDRLEPPAVVRDVHRPEGERGGRVDVLARDELLVELVGVGDPPCDPAARVGAERHGPTDDPEVAPRLVELPLPRLDHAEPDAREHHHRERGEGDTDDDENRLGPVVAQTRHRETDEIGGAAHDSSTSTTSVWRLNHSG